MQSLNGKPVKCLVPNRSGHAFACTCERKLYDWRMRIASERRRHCWAVSLCIRKQSRRRATDEGWTVNKKRIRLNSKYFVHSFVSASQQKHVFSFSSGHETKANSEEEAIHIAMAAINGQRRKLIYSLVVWIAQLSSIAVFIQYLREIYQQNGNHWPHVAHAIVKFYLFVNFVVATLTDPGIIPRNRWPSAANKSRHHRNETPKPIKIQIDDAELELTWCTTCQFHRPPRSVHCGTCNYCIEEFDHHCVWLNHCIGRRNYRFFFAFITLQTVDLCFTIGMCAWSIPDAANSIFALTILISVLALLTVPVLGLTVFHAIILLKGQTTHEFVADADADAGVKLMRNWSHVLFGALYPSLVNRRWNEIPLRPNWTNSKFINLSGTHAIFVVQVQDSSCGALWLPPATHTNHKFEFNSDGGSLSSINECLALGADYRLWLHWSRQRCRKHKHTHTHSALTTESGCGTN